MPSTTNVRLLAVERQRQSLELRKAGATYQMIADQMGYSSPQAAWRAVNALLRDVQVEATTEFRKVQFERLNYMIMKLWPRVQAGDEKAITTTANLMAQQDKLMGTETPVEHKVVHGGAVLVIEGGEAEYVQALEQMASQTGAAPVELENVGSDIPLGAIGPGDEDVIDAVIVDDEAEGTEPACPRFVRAADPERSAAGICARCPHTKANHV